VSLKYRRTETSRNKIVENKIFSRDNHARQNTLLYLSTKKSTLLYLYTRIAWRKMIQKHLRVCTTHDQAQSYETTKSDPSERKKSTQKSENLSRLQLIATSLHDEHRYNFPEQIPRKQGNEEERAQNELFGSFERSTSSSRLSAITNSESLRQRCIEAW